VVKVDDLSVTTEPAAVAEPALAVTQQIPVVTTTEQCAQCGAPLAHDQRYCLHCGEPRPHVSGPLSSKPAAQGPPQAPPVSPGSLSAHPSAPSLAPPGMSLAPPGMTGVPPGMPGSPPSGRNNSLALIAGVGVLLLAMGVGVLIGRADAPSVKAPPAQVISLGAATGGAAATTTTPTTTTPEVPAASSTPKKAAKAKEPTGTGSSITKPAPPSAAQNLRSGSGQSYEQKSKNLPNVVSTG
jgi:hypothetical protein